VPGFTNLTRNLVLGAFTGEESFFNIFTYVGLLSVPPTTDGDATGGLLDAEPIPLPRKLVVRGSLASPDIPYWVRGYGEYGGWKIALHNNIEWLEEETTNLTDSYTAVAGAVYTGITGGHMLAWDYLVNPVAVTPGGNIVIPSGELEIRMHKEIIL
jgi:hypothetical protein